MAHSNTVLLGPCSACSYVVPRDIGLSMGNDG